MSFKKAQSEIAKKQGISKDRAGAILGAAAKKSAAKASAQHKKTPANMKRVVKAQKGR